MSLISWIKDSFNPTGCVRLEIRQPNGRVYKTGVNITCVPMEENQARAEVSSTQDRLAVLKQGQVVSATFYNAHGHGIRLSIPPPPTGQALTAARNRIFHPQL